MCIRAYLNGDGSGYKTHLSLFFVLMKGEYDALLRWPFDYKVSMILVGKEGGCCTIFLRSDTVATIFFTVHFVELLRSGTVIGLYCTPLQLVMSCMVAVLSSETINVQ